MLLKESAKIFLIILTLSTSIYSQGTIIPLMQEGWVGGLSGFIGWDDYSAKANNADWDIDSETEGFGFVISSRNGRFVQDNLAFGFDFQWKEEHLTTTRYDVPLDVNPTEVYRKDKLGFIGFWLRYYIPFIGTGWAIYPEASVGYGTFKTTEEPNPFPESTGEVSRNADGLVYNVGFGGTIFVSNNVAFEATARYQGGKLAGDYENNRENLDNLEVKLSNIDILFGIMVYLR